MSCVAVKSPGLFLQVAALLHARLPQTRFRVVGEGYLLPALRELAARLRLAAVTEFAQWVPHERLPRALRDVQLVLNPSLWAAAETFCIANIEALALGVPLATFGVGGVGEYFSDAALCARAPNATDATDGGRRGDALAQGPHGPRLFLGADDAADDAGDAPPETDAAALATLCGADDAFVRDERWTLTATGLLLHSCQPRDVADALHGLLVRPAARRLVAEGGRRVVERRFSLQRQLRQYEELLRELHDAFAPLRHAAP